ncbi:MAG: hypothetical protein ACREFZ_11440 [Acetobacteraceae bacterium]
MGLQLLLQDLARLVHLGEPALQAPTLHGKRLAFFAQTTRRLQGGPRLHARGFKLERDRLARPMCRFVSCPRFACPCPPFGKRGFERGVLRLEPLALGADRLRPRRKAFALLTRQRHPVADFVNFPAERFQALARARLATVCLRFPGEPVGQHVACFAGRLAGLSVLLLGLV